jgi:hypothetical protein
MSSTRRRWIPIVIGIAILLAFAAVGGVIVSVAWLRQNLQVDAASQSDAESAFDEIQKRFASKPPLVTLKDGLASMDRAAFEDRPRSSLTAMNILAWDPDDSQLARMSIPFWLLRLKETPIEFGSYLASAGSLGISLRARDLEQYGPGIIIDASLRRGARALIWVE